MSADPGARYPDVQGFLADIERFQDGMAVEAWSEPVGQRLLRFARRNAVLLVLLASYTVVKFIIFFMRAR